MEINSEAPVTSLVSSKSVRELSKPSGDPESLVRRIQEWQSVLGGVGFDEKIQYVQDVNWRYDALANRASAEDLVELRLLRSLWAKRIAERLILSLPVLASNELAQVATLLSCLRTLIGGNAVECLITRQRQIGDQSSCNAIALLFGEHAVPEYARVGLSKLGSYKELLRRLGPARITKFRPSRKSGIFDDTLWLTQPEMSEVDFVDGNPDRVRVRGIELQSGDIGIVELNHPGDGLLESFLDKPGVAPHAMLFLTRRVLDPRTNRTLFQPSAIEIYEGGWRSVPITTALHPEFSWYSEWVRPRINGMYLRDDLGQVLSDAVDTMETFSFDFQARRIPTGGYFPKEFGGSCASCTNLIRVPFERAGIHHLPYPVTEVVPNAARNLAILGIPEYVGIHTPTNILNDSGYEKVGIVDNGKPEKSYAQALVIGGPDLPDTFGGWMSQKELVLKNLPHWTSVKNWKSAWEAFRVRMGQSRGLVGHAMRKLMNVEDDEVPKSVSDTTIAFYLRSDREAGHIMKNRVQLAVSSLLKNASELQLLSQLRTNAELVALVKQGLLESALKKENWYRPLS